VVTRDQYATPKSIQTAAPHISAILSNQLNTPTDKPIPVARPNVKWSKVSINGVPTGVTASCSTYNQTKMHDSLIINNPSYARLPVTQWPSWVRPPTSYTEGSVSSLSVAFEDLDGSKLKSLLAEKYLYIHGHWATICKWKQRQPICKDTSKPTTPEQPSRSRSNKDEDDEDVEIHLTPQPPTENQPAGTSSTLSSAKSTAPTQSSKPANQIKPRPPNPPCNIKGKTCKVT
jgi:hypothetical protein